MPTIEQSIEVNVPVRTAYNQWTQFEEFPQFMEGVEYVHQLDDTHLRWVAEVGGEVRGVGSRDHRAGSGPAHRLEVDAMAREQRRRYLPPSRRRQDSGHGPDGLGARGHRREGRERIGLDDRRVKGDLERFKELIESRGLESGAWRGEVEQASVR